VKAIYFMIAYIFINPAFSENVWFSKDWKVKRLLCPFGCSSILKGFFREDESIHFLQSSYKIPSFGKSCLPPHKVNWKMIKESKVGVYLDKWTKNKNALNSPKIRENLAIQLKLDKEAVILAGISSCSSGNSFNLIYVSPKKAYILFEENSFWELYK